VKLLFVGPLWEGSTARQRLQAFEQVQGLRVVSLDSGDRIGKANLVDRVRHKLRWPADPTRLNERLLAAASEQRFDVVFIDSTRVLSRATIRRLRPARRVFYSPDDVAQAHNSSRQLESCDAEWDVFFTTKSFNVPELAARGVRHPVLVGKSFDPELHRPMTREEVGEDYERFDVVFAGTFEEPRLRALNLLVEAGLRPVLYGNTFPRARLDPRIEIRPAKYALGYTATLHTGKVALCFLRKLNRDKVTQRSVEIPAAARPMVAEKTAEHDEMFRDGTEYLGFSTDEKMVEHVRRMVADDAARSALAEAGRRRCLESGYSAPERARFMLTAIGEASGNAVPDTRSRPPQRS
jgi:hypothetical protein